MFKHILIPIDGSEVSRRAAEVAVEFARLAQARLTALHVAPAYRPKVLEEQGASPDFVTPAEYAERERRNAAPYFSHVTDLASKLQVPSDAHSVLSDDPAEAIVEAAKRYGCDVIVMGSHGRTGIRGMLLGSVAQKVLTAGTVPVLVTR
jgi:nucleotide-binding universal stress UspA family protein